MNEQEIFHQALSLPPEARSVFLDHACLGDSAMRASVEGLLRAHDGASGFLDEPAFGAGVHSDVSPTDARIGAFIGHYRLVEQIGEGGMGTVYLAEQTHPVRRQVALKVIKPGMDSRRVVARFEAERQALALMDHPNIAKVLDAGATDLGRPYFVMEYVPGVPITRYCDDARMTVEERLRLFIPVCDAIQHAHQKGIIHRDVKPTNVIVTLYDGKPVPKVIDFGVAKAVEQELSDPSLGTQFGQVVGTLEYMAPEQAESSAKGIDTRADVYSLGVVLYELLVGSTPLSRDRMEQRTYAELVRVITELDPPTPSTRLGDSGERSASISAVRQTEPKRLAKLVRGELDWIVMRCLEKDRDRRYASANELAADLLRHLNDEAIQAGPPSALYRVRKFARRNKGPVLAATLILLTLVGGVVGTTTGMLEAKEARKAEKERADGEKTARQEAQKRLVQIEKSVDLLANIVRDLNPNNEGEGGRSVYEQLLERAEMAADALDAQAIGDPLTLARLQLRMGETLDGLGNSKKAAALLEKAHDGFKRLKGATDPETLAAAYAMANAWRGMGGRKVDDAVKILTQLREDRTKLVGPDHEDTFATANSLAAAVSVSGRNPAALAIYESIRDPMIRRLGNDHPVTLRALSNMATLYHHAGRHQDAIKIFEDVRKAETKSGGIPSLRFLHAGVRLAETLQSNGDTGAAIRLYEEVVDALRTRSPHHVSTFVAMNNMASAYFLAGRLDKSIPLLEELLRRASAKSGRSDRQALEAMIQLGANYLEVERIDEATKLLEEAFRSTRDHEQRRSSGSTLTHAYAKAGRRRDSLFLADKMAYECRRDFPEGHRQRAEWLHYLGSALLTARAPIEAETLLRESLAIRAAKEPDAWTTFGTEALLGAALFRQGNVEEAEPLLLEGFKGLKARKAKIPPRETALFDATDSLARFYSATTKADLAAKWRKEADDLKVARRSVDSGRTLSVSDGSLRAQTPVADAQGSLSSSGNFLVLIRPLLALVDERQTERRPAGVILGAATVLFQETPVMRGYRLFGLLALAASAATAPEAAAQYAFSPIDVPGSTRNVATDVNSAEDIVGGFTDANGVSRAYLLRGTLFTFLNIPGSTSSECRGINNLGQIVGVWNDGANSNKLRGFLWLSGDLTPIDVPGATATRAHAIGNDGTIVGNYTDANNLGHAFILKDGVFTFPPDFPGAISSDGTVFKSINDSGDIVGDYTDPTGVVRGLLYSDGTYTAIDYPGSTTGSASGIDATGTIVGQYQHPNSGVWYGYMLRDGVYSTVEIPGATDSRLVENNDLGSLVGNCVINGKRVGFRTITPKYLAVDDVSATGGDAVYQYDSNALASVPQPLYSFNNATRGMTRNASGTQYWMINSNRTVFVYDANFQPTDFWTAWGIPTGFQLEGIATAGNDLWILDAKTDKVFKFNNAALPSSDDQFADSSFKLNNKNTSPKDLVTNGTYFWVLDDSGTDKVFKYTMTGAFVSSFTLATSGATTPRAISIDPANPNDLWIADGGTKRVYKYANAVNAANNSSQSAASSFPLAAGNTNPQGLAIKP